MMRNVALAVLLLLPAACFSGYSDETPDAQELRVRRGSLQQEIVLSGEVEAARGELLSVPRIPFWQTAIKTIVEDGSEVKAGEPVVELDNTALTSELDTKRQAAAQSAQQLQQREAEWSADLEQKALDVEKRRADRDKAEIEAKVPAELLSARAYEEKQSALRRATIEYEKAVDELAARRRAIDAERRNLVLELQKTEREIEQAERAIDALVLRAPRSGIVVVQDGREGRKLQSGDTAWVGMPLALLPELESMRVKAALADVDDGRVAVGMPVTITLDGYPELQFRGKVSSISAVAQESARASLRRHFEVRVDLERLDLERMRPGLSARVVVHRGERSAVLLAPRAALDLSGTSARARLANGTFRDVKLGACNAQECVVEGLGEGTRLASIVEVTRG